MWLPNRQRPLVQKVAPGFQQTSGSKEAVASLRRGHIQRLNLRYTQVSRQELRCLTCTAQDTQRREGPGIPQSYCPPHTAEHGAGYTGNTWFRDERLKASHRAEFARELGLLGA
jgi:hypothetical protein